MNLQSKSTRITVDENIMNDIVNRVENGESFDSIGHYYNENKDTIRMRYNRYLKKQGIIKEDLRITSGTTCIELGISFKTLKEAAIFLINTNLIDGFNCNSTSYKISKAIKNGNTFKGVHWSNYDNSIKEYKLLNSDEKRKL